MGASAPSWLTDWTYAHRGLHGPDGALENSLPAFRAAIARGHGIECDIQQSRDGCAMVFHDWTLDRLTDERGAVRERNAADLQRIGLHQASGTIPTLDAMLRLVAGRVPILVEVKSRRDVDWRPLARAAQRALAPYRGPAALMSFDPDIVHWLLRHSRRPVGMVIGRGEWQRAGGRGGFAAWRGLAIQRLDPDFIACDIADLPDPWIARLRAQGLPVLSWTIRSRKLAARAAIHVDAPIAEGAGLP
ncbi:glycerophosphodiester phosphodiesterase family protein [Croceicoccus marinus]|uniref:GP-PDE domain-containing protein n=1 Tax=Croceicoccus marinus TaxID=450378 RepID=A0A1Z1F801_9SPHN|nr:glycerophosphodiester phosphodiesterase family protein [Croceicoccus marinus]ARU14928.1 hypothetical protein A9D14_00515 [Croceicoccus marinus]